MASIRKEIPVSASAEATWDAIRDFGAVHERVAPGFVTGLVLEDDARVVTFANGTTARELLVDCDDSARRLVYAIVGGRVRTHSASVTVETAPAGCRVIWTTDVLPHELAPYISAQMDEAASIMAWMLAGEAAAS
jgi:hypothetical protein